MSKIDRIVFEGVDAVLLDDSAATEASLTPVSDTVVVKFREETGLKIVPKTDELKLRDPKPAIDAGLSFSVVADAHSQQVERSGVPESTLNVDVNTLNELVSDRPELAVEPMFLRPLETLVAERTHAEAVLGTVVGDPTLYGNMTMAEPTHERLREVLEVLRSMETVELAYIAPMPMPATTDIAPTTPLMTGQGYLDAAPVGIDARYAWRCLGGRGRGVQIVDIEWHWDLSHEDLPRTFRGGNGMNPFGLFPEHHGTAVLGMLGALDNAYGLVGICPEAALATNTCARIFGGVAGALDEAASWLSPGDLLLIEMHLPGPTTPRDWLSTQDGYVPVEHFQAEFDVIQRITARGVIVVEAAGNGGMNLDDATVFGARFQRERRDSGAIMVGAGSANGGLSPLDFSNHGSRVDVHGWGEAVATLGYGDVTVPGAEADKRQWYTMNFSGTSSASPVVTGAAAAIQGACAASGTVKRTPAEMRLLLRDTGTPQASSTRLIGPLPNLRRALNSLGISEPVMPTVPWPSRGGVIQSIPAIGQNGDGRIEVFAVGADRALWHQWQTAPSNGWSNWSRLGDGLPPGTGLIGNPTVEANAVGALEVFCRATDLAIWHIWQDGGSVTGWSNWASLGGRAISDPAVEVNHDGRLEVFVRWEDGSLHHIWQRFTTGWWSWWESLGGTITGVPAAGHNADRRIEVFARGSDGQLHQKCQTSPGGDWTEWIGPNGAIIGDPVVGHTGTGAQTRMEVFAVAPSQNLALRWQTAPNNGWSDFIDFGGPVYAGTEPAVTADAAGRLQVAVRWHDSTVRFRCHAVGPSPWSDWVDLGGGVSSRPGVGLNADGRIEIFAQGSGGDLVHRWQPW